MTYDSRETSVEAGQPVELFLFTLGSATYRYTSAEDDITISGAVYSPRNIARTGAAMSDGDRDGNLQITLPADDPVCQYFIGVVSGQPLFLTILRVHRGDTEVYNVWSGRVVSAAFQQNATVCSLSGVTSETAFSRSLPSYKYQSLCNHMLYTTDCGALRDSFKFAGTVTSATGLQITVAGLLAAKGAYWALGGYVSFNNVDFRLVVAQAGDVLTLVLGFGTGISGQVVEVFAGCDHTLATCTAKFANQINYGGFPNVPTLNPFSTSLR